MSRSVWIALTLLLPLVIAAMHMAGAQPPTAPTPRPAVDPAKLSKQESMYLLAAQRGAEWLKRSNRLDGRFGYINSPSLRTRQESESFSGQAEGAIALGLSASAFGDKDAAAQAAQAVLALLIDTTLDESRGIRVPVSRGSTQSPLAAAGAMLQAIYAMPNPGADLHKQGDELSMFIGSQVRTDGGLGQTGDDLSAASHALLGLARSQQARPAPWKLDVLRKAHAYYQPRWQANKELQAAPRLCAAWAEAYRQTKEQGFADSLFALSDWLCSLQYVQLVQERSHWFGGFHGWSDGKPLPTAPDASQAALVQGLAEARAIARQNADAQRHKRYQEALERGLLFLLALQYTPANTRHFVEDYRPELLGAFHVSQQNGDIRLEQTSQAVAALLKYVW